MAELLHSQAKAAATIHKQKRRRLKWYCSSDPGVTQYLSLFSTTAYHVITNFSFVDMLFCPRCSHFKVLRSAIMFFLIGSFGTV